jgi:hypothetical protein
MAEYRIKSFQPLIAVGRKIVRASKNLTVEKASKTA